MEKVKKLSTLQGIRVMATLGIFLFHSGFLLKGTFPVTLFFMLSGFMMYYTKRDTIEPLTGLRKMKKMYPLHFLTFIAAIFVGNTWKNYTWEYAIKATVLQITLLQSWIPEYTFTYNGLSWYLSITCFLYAISYPLVKFVKKIKSPVKGIIVILGIITVLNLIANNMGGGLYSNPLYRVLDFGLGMLIAKLFIEKKDTAWCNTSTEITLVIVFAIQYIVSLFINDMPGYYSILFSVALYVFAVGKGGVSKFLSLPVFDKLAKYSFEFYMIHELVLRIFRKVFAHIDIFYPVKLALIAIPAFIGTIICIIIYEYIKKIKKTGRISRS